MTAADLFEYGLQEMSLFQFPAWEMKRIFQTDAPDVDWQLLFEQAGGTLVCERMVALKTDAVWRKLITEEIFKIARDSGMFWEPVPREDCVALELIPAEEPGSGKFRPFVIDGKTYTEDALRELEKKIARQRENRKITSPVLKNPRNL
jgi:hypothetical protein